MSLASHQKRIIRDLASKFSTASVVDALRSLADDLEPGDYRAALAEEAARRLELPAVVPSIASLLVGPDAFMNEAILQTDMDPVPCPECGYAYLCPVMVWINWNGEIVKVGNGETVRFEGEGVGRGSLVALKYRGECGHTVYRKFQFHKGETLVEERAISADEPDGSEAEDS